MFGTKKMYKKGLSDAMNAYQDFGRKQEDALAAIRKEVREGKKQLEDALAGLGDEVIGIYDYLDAKERAALYHLNTPYDIKNLDESEQRLLLAVLYQLAEDEGSRLNDCQRTYLHGVQRYLGITNPQVGIDDLSVVGDIDSGTTQKAILQTVLEFFYLQDSDDLTDTQDEFLSDFSVSKKQALTIENTVSRLFNAVGSKGLSEKYGNDEVIQQAEAQAEDALNNFEKKINRNWLHVSSSIVYATVYSGRSSSSCSRMACLESESYKEQNKCRKDAQRELERYHREAEKKFTSYTKRYGDNSIYKSLIDNLDIRFVALKEDLSKIRNPKTSSVLTELETYLIKTKVIDDASAICDRLAEKYRLPDSSSYTDQIEYEVSDPSEYEDNLFAKVIASGFKRYGYNIYSALDAIDNDGKEILKDFIEDLNSQFNDLIDRYITDPIQKLLPKLQDALLVSDGDV